MKIHYYTTILVVFFVLWGCSTHEYKPDTKQSSYEPIVSQDISFLDINDFAQDAFGYMWIATLGGLDRYNGYDYLHFSHQASDSTSLLNDFVFSLLIDSSHNLWVGTSAGLNRFNYEKQCFERYTATRPAPVYSMFETSDRKVWLATPSGAGYINKEAHKIVFPNKTEAVNLLWEDKSQRLWMGLNGDQGLAVRKNNNEWKYFTLPGNRKVTCIYADPQNKWWLGTDHGIVIFDPITQAVKSPIISSAENELLNKTQITFIKEIEPLKLLIGTATEGFFCYDIVSHSLQQNTPLRFNPLLSPQLHTCYSDKQGNVWIGSYDKGFIVNKKDGSNFNTNQTLSNYFKGIFVTRILEDTDKNLWISTRYKGLYWYNAQKGIKKVTQLPEKGFLEDIYIDSQKRIWLSFEHKLLKGNITKEGSIQVKKQFDIENVRVVKEDKQGNIWIGSWNGLYKLTEHNGSATLQKIYTANIPDIRVLHTGDILFSAFGNGIFRIKPNTTAAFPVKFPHRFMPIATNCVTIFEDMQNRIWLGTYGNGALCYKDRTYIPFFVATGLPNNNTLCFKEDLDGNIWLSTSHGIAIISFARQQPRIKNFYKADGTLGDQYHEKAGCKGYDGKIFFGGNHGITFFNPSDIKPDTYAPTVNIEDLKIFNKSARPGEKGSPLQKNILLTKEITLNHRQTTISIDYAGIDFLSPQKLTYKYKLEGFEKQWNYVGTFRRAAYSNLPPGSYTFCVSAINGDGVESSRPARLQIIIKPASWLTWQAWLFYILCTIGLSIFIIRFLIRLRLNKQLTEIEHNERKREQEIALMKMTFFTNISHELRTPLTLISAPLEKIISSQSDAKSTHLLNTIARNTKRMWQLVNQIMDFSKIENSTLRLHVQHTDIINRLRDIHESFLYIAERKGIEMSFSPHAPEQTMWTDLDKIEKILYNLLSNAIKHTPSGKSISLSTQHLDAAQAATTYGISDNESVTDYLEINVTDHGEGILENKIKDLFVRYQQIEMTSGYKPDYSGNGIGLHYTKTLVNTHKGHIKATAVQGGGMSFSFVLPLDDIYTDKEKQEVTESLFVTSPLRNEAAEQPQQDTPKGKTYTLLVAEDNVELLDFIADTLSQNYSVIKAPDGKRAWEAVKRHTPDLVLTDVIMPGMSGYELCSAIKDDIDYCQIPVVMLTAKTVTADRIEGLDRGADAYICKPFGTNELLLTIKNLLKHKERLRHYFTTPGMSEQAPSDQPFLSADYIFMNKLNTLLEAELANPDLDIDDIAARLGYSRSVFYRRLKALVNIAPNDFLRTYRLKRAAELLASSTLSLAEISDRTGFSSYSYFSKTFKKQFDMSPKNYRANQTPHISMSSL
ncbi:hypothetical protein HMPREF1199_01383 [Hoylesella oralis CC98A]|nr:hypothetical protein HMPREF1199_01383 [Hoylesella oralis CC98A]